MKEEGQKRQFMLEGKRGGAPKKASAGSSWAERSKVFGTYRHTVLTVEYGRTHIATHRHRSTRRHRYVQLVPLKLRTYLWTYALYQHGDRGALHARVRQHVGRVREVGRLFRAHVHLAQRDLELCRLRCGRGAHFR